MLSDCFNLEKNTGSNIKNHGKIMILSHYAVCGGKKSGFIKEQKASGIYC